MNHEKSKPRPQISKPVSSKSKAEEPPCTEFRFVNQLGTREQGEEAKSDVKSHVMRRVWKKHKDSQKKWIKRLQPLRPKDPSTPNSGFNSDVSSFGSPDSNYQHSASSSRLGTPRNPVTPSADVPEQEVDYQGQDSVDHSMIPIPSGYAQISPRTAAYVFGSDIDQSGLLPFHCQSVLHQLHQRGTQYSAPTSYYGNSIESFSCVETNRALLYITLSWLSARNGDTFEPGNFESSLYLQTSLSATNEELESAAECGVSEGTIAAVACMTDMEILNGDNCKASIHLNGLEQMVNIRGGLYALSPALQQHILRTDLLCATKWLTAPRFPYMNFSYLQPLALFRPTAGNMPLFSINNYLKNNLVEMGNESLLTTMQNAHELALFIDDAQQTAPAYINNSSYPDRVYSIEHHILELLSRNNFTTTDSAADIVMPFLHSLLLYTYTILRPNPAGGLTGQTLAGRLQISLQATELTFLNCSFANELTWMLFLGGVAASQGSEDHRWFKEQLWWVLNRNMALERSWDQTTAMLKNVLWLGRKFLEKCHRFWLETLDLEWVAQF